LSGGECPRGMSYYRVHLPVICDDDIDVAALVSMAARVSMTSTATTAHARLVTADPTVNIAPTHATPLRV